MTVTGSREMIEEKGTVRREKKNRGKTGGSTEWQRGEIEGAVENGREEKGE
jgi:hypothetical protein